MNPVLEQIWAHRSIRSYKPDPVPEETLQEILQAALRAASSGNLQTWSVIVTRDPVRKERLFELHFEQEMILQAPVVLAFCADWHRTSRWCEARRAEPGYDNLLSFLVGAADALLAAQNAVLAAESLGLGTCYMGTTWNSLPELAEFYGLPPGVAPVTSVVLGHPAENPDPRMRLPLSGLVHEERYRLPDADEIEETYRLRDSEGWQRYMAFPELAKRMRESGVKNLAQVYTRLKYTKERGDADSRRILEALAKLGFMGQG